MAMFHAWFSVRYSLLELAEWPRGAEACWPLGVSGVRQGSRPVYPTELAHQHGTWNKIRWLRLVPTSTTRFASDVGYRMTKFNRVIQGKLFLWTMASNSLTEDEGHDIPSQIFKNIFGWHASVIFQTSICVVSNLFVGSFDPRLKWSIGRTSCLYHSTRVNLYSHQIVAIPSSLLQNAWNAWWPTCPLCQFEEGIADNESVMRETIPSVNNMRKINIIGPEKRECL